MGSQIGRRAITAVLTVLTRTTYIGRHRFNAQFHETREREPKAEAVEMVALADIDAADFESVQRLLKAHSPAMTAPRIVTGRYAPPVVRMLLS